MAGVLPVDSEPPMTYAQAVPLMDGFSHPIKLIVNALGPPPPGTIERAQLEYSSDPCR